MKNKILILFILVLFLSGCVGVGSSGIFGTGVSVALIQDLLVHKLMTQLCKKIYQQELSFY